MISNELVKLWKETVIAYVRVRLLSQYLPGGTEENHKKNPLKSPGRDLNRRRPEYEAGVPITRRDVKPQIPMWRPSELLRWEWH